jgi:hypothetical protein
MSTCKKCNNSYQNIPKKDGLYKICRICNYEEKATVDDYKLFSQDNTKKGKNFHQYLLSSIEDNTCPIVVINNIKYTLIVQSGTLEHIYISHKDNKVYTDINQLKKINK